MLDNTFDTDGMVTTDVGSDADMINSIAIQSDGKIVAAGSAKIGGVAKFAVLRYNSNGSLDNTFGTGGIVTTSIGSSSSAASIAIQSDGKIVAAGYALNTNGDFAVARYNSDGSLDITFDTDGIVTAPVGLGNDFANAMVIQADGKILLAGNVNIGSVLNFGLARLNTNGSLDITFNTTGVLTTVFTGMPSEALSIAMQADSKIVVAGKATANNATSKNFALARYNTDGSLDITFDTDGMLTTDLGTGNDVGKGVKIQPDGKILVAGETQPGGNDENFALVRYNTNGSLDNAFGTGGIATTDFFTNIDNPSSLVLQADGKIIVAGSSYNPSSFPDFSLARYEANGSLDNTFGTGGKVWTNFGTGANTVRAVALQADGKIVAGGSINSGTATSDFALARYTQINTAGIDDKSSVNAIGISPNPFCFQTTLQTESVFNNATLTINNHLGQTVKQIDNISGQSITLFRDNLQSGLYFIHLTQDNKTIATNKLVIAD
ncbi:MAG: T9SS type A sorting domain-containing protein [Chitinophagales bacterium]|nr:T9SS type A sorting domain-containing protein [Chitinophagales bacterium]